MDYSKKPFGPPADDLDCFSFQSSATAGGAANSILIINESFTPQRPMVIVQVGCMGYFQTAAGVRSSVANFGVIIRQTVGGSAPPMYTLLDLFSASTSYILAAVGNYYFTSGCCWLPTYLFAAPNVSYSLQVTGNVTVALNDVVVTSLNILFRYL